MSNFTYWKGVADAAVGVILLTRPEIIYHSVIAKLLNRLSGLRLPNPYPTSEGEISSQHAVAIIVSSSSDTSNHHQRDHTYISTGYRRRSRSCASEQRPPLHTGLGRHECSLVDPCAWYRPLQAAPCDERTFDDGH